MTSSSAIAIYFHGRGELAFCRADNTRLSSRSSGHNCSYWDMSLLKSTLNIPHLKSSVVKLLPSLHCTPIIDRVNLAAQFFFISLDVMSEYRYKKVKMKQLSHACERIKDIRTWFDQGHATWYLRCLRIRSIQRKHYIMKMLSSNVSNVFTKHVPQVHCNASIIHFRADCPISRDRSSWPEPRHLAGYLSLLARAYACSRLHCVISRHCSV